MDREILHKEIDLIQTCINRMANNSFLLKGWSITIVAVVLALADKAANPALLSAILLIPLLSFWYLDAFFLRTEKMYCKLYAWVLEKRSANDNSYLYDLDPHRFKDQADSAWEVMWSVTLRCFYGVPAVLTLGVIIYRIVISVLVKGRC